MDYRPIREIASQAFSLPEQCRDAFIQQAVAPLVPEDQRLEWLHAIALELERLLKSPFPSPPPAAAAPHASQPLGPEAGRRVLPASVDEKYMLLGDLGEGGMGRVYLARNRDLTKACGVVALKTLAPELGRNESSLRRFEQEIHLLASLDHPRIVRPIEVLPGGDGSNWLAMEYVDGVDLRKKVEQAGPLPVREACELALQAADALGYLHSKEIIHRDIKPSNLLLNKSNELKLADLGLACALGPQRLDLTKTGTAVGTLDYMAPEQIDGDRQIDQTADIYGLGCTLFFLLAGQPPFGHVTSLSGKILSHRESPLPDIQMLRKRAGVSEPIPRLLKKAIQRATAKKPGKRYPTCEHFAQDLRRCLRTNRGTRVAVWAGLALAAGLVLVFVYNSQIQRRVIGWVNAVASPPDSSPADSSPADSSPADSITPRQAIPLSLTACYDTIRDYLLDETKVANPSLVRFIVIPCSGTGASGNTDEPERYLATVRAILRQQPDAPVPRIESCGPQRAILAVHLDENMCLPGGREWREMIDGYPYFVHYDEVSNHRLSDADLMVRAMTGRDGADVRRRLPGLSPDDAERRMLLYRAAKERFPLLRGDWLVATHAHSAQLDDECQQFAAEVLRQYAEADVDLTQARLELNATDIRPELSDQEIRERFGDNELLCPLAQGNRIGRDTFARCFSDAVMLLKLGSPVSFSIGTRSLQSNDP